MKHVCVLFLAMVALVKGACTDDVSNPPPPIKVVECTQLGTAFGKAEFEEEAAEYRTVILEFCSTKDGEEKCEDLGGPITNFKVVDSGETKTGWESPFGKPLYDTTFQVSGRGGAWEEFFCDGGELCLRGGDVWLHFIASPGRNPLSLSMFITAEGWEEDGTCRLKGQE